MLKNEESIIFFLWFRAFRCQNKIQYRIFYHLFVRKSMCTGITDFVLSHFYLYVCTQKARSQSDQRKAPFSRFLCCSRYCSLRPLSSLFYLLSSIFYLLIQIPHLKN